MLATVSEISATVCDSSSNYIAGDHDGRDVPLYRFALVELGYSFSFNYN
jgi:hypothetical protein